MSSWSARQAKRASWRENPGSAEIIRAEDLENDRHCLDVVHALVRDYADRLRREIPLDDVQRLLFLRSLSCGFSWSRGLLEQQEVLRLTAAMIQTPANQVDVDPDRVSSAEYLPTYREQLKERVRRLREGSPYLRRHHRSVLESIGELRRAFAYHTRRARANAVEMKGLAECVEELATASDKLEGEPSPD